MHFADSKKISVVLSISCIFPRSLFTGVLSSALLVIVTGLFITYRVESFFIY